MRVSTIGLSTLPCDAGYWLWVCSEIELYGNRPSPILFLLKFFLNNPRQYVTPCFLALVFSLKSVPVQFLIFVFGFRIFFQFLFNDFQLGIVNFLIGKCRILLTIF